MAMSKSPARISPIAFDREEIWRVSVVHILEARPLLAIKAFQRGWVSQIISELGKDSRSAATAGKVCTISPSDPRRTTRKRRSATRLLAQRFEQGSSGVILWVA